MEGNRELVDFLRGRAVMAMSDGNGNLELGRVGDDETFEQTGAGPALLMERPSFDDPQVAEDLEPYF